MSITKFGSYSPVLPKMWEDFFGEDILKACHCDGNCNCANCTCRSSVPAVNIEERPDAFVITLAAPGMKREDFNIMLEGNTLTIAAKHEQRHEEKDEAGRYTRREFSYQSFKRSFTLPESVQAGQLVSRQIGAQYQDGILSIRLPKKEAEPSKHPTRRIEVK